MITLFVIGYFIYIGIGFTGLTYLADKYLNDNKVCVTCILYLSLLVWGFLPFTLMFDFR